MYSRCNTSAVYHLLVSSRTAGAETGGMALVEIPTTTASWTGDRDGFDPAVVLDTHSCLGFRPSHFPTHYVHFETSNARSLYSHPLEHSIFTSACASWGRNGSLGMASAWILVLGGVGCSGSGG